MNKISSFESLFQESPVATIILNGSAPDFVLIEVNESFLDFSQLSRKACVGKALPEYFPDWDIEAVDKIKAALHQTVDEKILVKSKVQQYKRTSQGGIADDARYLEAIIKPILSSNKEIQYIICSLQDVSESVQAQQKEGSDFKSPTEVMLPVPGMGTWELDANGFIRWSDTHRNIFEAEQAWIPSLENMLGFFKDSEIEKKFSKIFDEAVRTGASFEADFEITTAKGNSRWLRFRGEVEIEKGGAIRISGTTEDVSFHKKAGMPLIGAADHLEQLIQSIPGAVWEADVSSLTVSYMSLQITTMLGYDLEECVGQPGFWQNRLHPDGKEEAMRYTLEQVKSCRNFSHQYRIRKKDNSYVWLKIFFSMIYEDDHPTQPRWIRGLITDVTITKLYSDIERLEKNVLELNANPNILLKNVLIPYMAGLETIFPQMVCAVVQIKNGKMYNWASPTLSPEYESLIEKMPIGENVVCSGPARSSKEMVIVRDIASDPSWADHKEQALKENLHACWSYPLVDSSGEVMATLALYYPSIKSPSDEEVKLIERTAAMLALILEYKDNEELLKESNFLMKQSQELAHFGNVHWDIPSDQLTLSTELYNILGLTPQQKHVLTGDFEYIHPEDRDKVKSKFIDLLTVKNDLVLEQRIVWPNGEVRHLKSWIKVNRDHQGAPLQLIGACLDITENKETEERLRASEQRLRNIMDSQSNYVVRIDMGLQYTFVNKKFSEDFAINANESLLGLDFFKIFAADRRPRVKETVQACIAQPDRIFTVEIEEIVADGFDKSIFWHFVCLTDNQGLPLEIQGIGTDISDRKKAEKEMELKNTSLEASEKRYKELFHLSPQPMYVVEIESSKFLDVNQAAIQQYGYSREEFLSMTVNDIGREEEVPNLIELVNKSQKYKTHSHREIFTHQSKNGHVMKLDVHSNPIIYEGKAAMLLLAHNVTVRLDYLKALEIQNKKLKEIAWTQSHVVRAPLARIMGLIGAIKDNPAMIDENIVMVEHMLSSAIELDNIIRDITQKAEQARMEIKD